MKITTLYNGKSYLELATEELGPRWLNYYEFHLKLDSYRPAICYAISRRLTCEMAVTFLDLLGNPKFWSRDLLLHTYTHYLCVGQSLSLFLQSWNLLLHTYTHYLCVGQSFSLFLQSCRWFRNDIITLQTGCSHFCEGNEYWETAGSNGKKYVTYQKVQRTRHSWHLDMATVMN